MINFSMLNIKTEVEKKCNAINKSLKNKVLVTPYESLETDFILIS